MATQELTFKISVTSAQAQAEMRRLTSVVNAEIKKINQNSAQEVAKLKTAFTTEFQNIANKVPLVGNALGGLSTQAGELTTALGTTGEAAVTAGGALGAMAGPIGIATAALIAELGAVVALADGLFELAKSTAEVQGKMFDLSQQTGVSVETLSALDLLAQTTGGNIEAVAASLGIFQKNLEAAQDSTTKQAKAFKNLGVETHDTEEALDQTLKALSQLPEGFSQTALALELFGRGGKQMLAILKESHGDLTAVKNELREMGLGSTAAAKQADDFNDELIRLNTQLLGLKVTIGNQVIPPILSALKDLRKAISENKDAIDALAFAARFAANSLSGQLKFALAGLNAFFASHKGELIIIVDLYERLAAAAQLVTNRVPNIDPNAIPAQAIPRSEVGPQIGVDTSAGAGIFRQFNKAIKSGGGADPALQLLKQLQSELRNLEGATKLESIAAELLDTKFKHISPTIKEQILLTARLIDTKKLSIAADEELKRVTEERQALLEHETDLISDFIFAQEKTIKPLTDLDEANKFIGESFLRTGNAIEANIQNLIRLNAMTIESKKHMDDFADSLRKVGELTPNIAPNGIPEFDPKHVFDDSSLGIPPEAEKHFRGLQKELDAMGESFGKLIGLSKEFGEQFGRDFGDVALGAIEDLASGVGNLVEQYVLLGTTGPAALRKLLAATLAHLAAEAAVKAVFQLAEGFASLFINPAEAAGHFKAAALFGSIAGVAAVAGRGVAGDLFQQKTNNSGANQSTNNGQLNPLTFNRNQPQVVTVIVKPDGSKFGDAITAHILDDHSQAGPIRETFANDGRF